VGTVSGAAAHGRPPSRGRGRFGAWWRRAPDLGVGTLTLFALSSDNLKRPARELAVLFGVVGEYLEELAASGVSGPRVQVIGRRDRLPRRVADAAGAAEAATAGASGIRLRLAIDYSARDALLRAVCSAVRAGGIATDGALTVDSFPRFLDPHSISGAPDVDLLIRTGGEQRLSDFLLWECAYAELLFSDVLWPDFGAADLAAALLAYRRRDRRFGLVRAASVS